MTDVFGYVKRLSDLAVKFNVQPLAECVLNDPRFSRWSGSSKPEQHHYGESGLLVHTTEVVELCLLNNSYFGHDKKVPEGELYLAALFHDTGKMWDYEPVAGDYTTWRGTKHKRKIHHVSRSGLVWMQAVHSTKLYEMQADDIYHAILAHHGLRDWGSPVSPATRIAWLLHLCDGISARMDDCYKWDRLL